MSHAMIDGAAVRFLYCSLVVSSGLCFDLRSVAAG